MKINPRDPYEVKKKKLALVPPRRHPAILDVLARGESVDVSIEPEIKNDPFIPALTELLKNRTIDLTKYENLYYIVNRRVLPLRHLLGRKQYDPFRQHAHHLRRLNADNSGFSDGKTLRHIGAFPSDVYQAIVEQYPNADERALVVQWLLKTKEGQPYATVEKL